MVAAFSYANGYHRFLRRRLIAQGGGNPQFHLQITEAKKDGMWFFPQTKGSLKKLDPEWGAKRIGFWQSLQSKKECERTNKKAQDEVGKAKGQLLQGGRQSPVLTETSLGFHFQPLMGREWWRSNSGIGEKWGWRNSSSTLKANRGRPDCRKERAPFSKGFRKASLMEARWKYSKKAVSRVGLRLPLGLQEEESKETSAYSPQSVLVLPLCSPSRILIGPRQLWCGQSVGQAAWVRHPEERWCLRWRMQVSAPGDHSSY